MREPCGVFISRVVQDATFFGAEDLRDQAYRKRSGRSDGTLLRMRSPTRRRPERTGK